jgi:hypothetical protein
MTVPPSSTGPAVASVAQRLALRAAALLVAFTAPVSGKTPPTVRLVYDRTSNATDCPDRDAVLDSVRARLGFDPFRERGDITIHALVSRVGEELFAQIRLSDQTAQATGERRLVSHRADCGELASAMELALSIAIDQTGTLGPLSSSREPATSSRPAVVLTVTPAAFAHEPSTARRSPPGYSDVQAGIEGNVGDVIAPTVGGFAGLEWRSQHWSVSIEGRADLPRSRSVGGGSINAGTLAATLAPCLRQGPFGACALATLEALRGSGQDLDNAHQLTSLFAAVGGRALVEFPDTGSAAVRLHADVVSPLTRTTLKVGPDAVWTSPPVTAAVGLAVVVKFR